MKLFFLTALLCFKGAYSEETNLPTGTACSYTCDYDVWFCWDGCWDETRTVTNQISGDEKISLKDIYDACKVNTPDLRQGEQSIKFRRINNIQCN